MSSRKSLLLIQVEIQVRVHDADAAPERPRQLFVQQDALALIPMDGSLAETLRTLHRLVIEVLDAVRVLLVDVVHSV